MTNGKKTPAGEREEKEMDKSNALQMDVSLSPAASTASASNGAPADTVAVGAASGDRQRWAKREECNQIQAVTARKRVGEETEL